MKLIRNFTELSGINQFSWLNPLFLALFPAAVLIWLQPVTFLPFIFELYEVADKEQYIVWFEDLENDGKKEKFMFGTDNMNVLNMMYIDDNGRLKSQVNFDYSFAKKRELIKPVCADFDADGSKDIVLFSQKNDSLLFNIFSYKKKNIN